MFFFHKQGTDTEAAAAFDMQTTVKCTTRSNADTCSAESEISAVSYYVLRHTKLSPTPS